MSDTHSILAPTLRKTASDVVNAGAFPGCLGVPKE
jgi:hypothetical protein